MKSVPKALSLIQWAWYRPVQKLRCNLLAMQLRDQLLQNLNPGHTIICCRKWTKLSIY